MIGVFYRGIISNYRKGDILNIFKEKGGVRFKTILIYRGIKI